MKAELLAALKQHFVEIAYWANESEEPVEFDPNTITIEITGIGRQQTTDTLNDVSPERYKQMNLSACTTADDYLAAYGMFEPTLFDVFSVEVNVNNRPCHIDGADVDFYCIRYNSKLGQGMFVDVFRPDDHSYAGIAFDAFKELFGEKKLVLA